jgi:hypothetical protein
VPTDTPSRWDGDNVVITAGFHTFTLAYIEPMAEGRYLLAIYGWGKEPAIVPPETEDRPEPIPEVDGAVEIPCRSKAEARELVAAMFRIRGWEIAGG